MVKISRDYAAGAGGMASLEIVAGGALLIGKAPLRYPLAKTEQASFVLGQQGVPGEVTLKKLSGVVPPNGQIVVRAPAGEN
jgi:hypothetical protein